VKIGITGIGGLLGWHLRAYLYSGRKADIRGADRVVCSDPRALQDFVKDVDAVVHLAGMNRGEDSELEKTNIDLTGRLIAACETGRSKPHIVFASSTHADRDTAYGRSKRACAAMFRQWSETNRARFTNLILPHVYGESGKPFYNSVVSTFCHQIASRETPGIVTDGDLELVHAQDVAARVFQVIGDGEIGDVRVRGRPAKVSEFLARLSKIAELYGSQVVPDLRDSLDLRLFNTYRSYLFPDYYPVTLSVHEDNRGALFEAVKSHNAGQMFFSTTKPGITRGNHYHTRKFERFLVTSGEAVIRLRRLFSGEIVEFRVSGSKPQYIDMPTFHTHNITNTGSTDLTTVFWAHELFDKDDSDTYPEPVNA
jgi:UDP-2-acetamido-2,6-beta-L-arabino-hexul-4-ose reductase